MKGNSKMKKTFLFFLIFFLMVLPGCVSATMTPTEIPASATFIPTIEAAAATPTELPPSSAGTVISYGRLTLVVPPEVASGASCSEYPRVDGEDAAQWQKTPGHLQVMLGDYYILQGKLRQAEIYVYPAQDYAELVPAAFESMHRLNNILGDPGAQISSEQLPAVPFFNEKQVFVANIQVISFQNGQGVRFLTEYAQSPVSANNQDLFYQFQGLTSDGSYYVIAILPITAPGLGESSDPAAAIPIGGIAYPDKVDPNANWDGYYAAVTELLNTTSPDAFVPAINQLDLLIQSMQIMP
jgi:hypothetical protein